MRGVIRQYRVYRQQINIQQGGSGNELANIADDSPACCHRDWNSRHSCGCLRQFLTGGIICLSRSGQNLGLLDASGAFHPFKMPAPFAAVGEYTFDGNGSFTRVDYNVALGTPAFPPTSVNDQGFRTGVTGTYSVSEDCTATFTVALAATSQVVLAVALVDYGERAFATIKSEQVSSYSPVANTSDLACDAGCNVAVQFTEEVVRNTTRRR